MPDVDLTDLDVLGPGAAVRCLVDADGLPQPLLARWTALAVTAIEPRLPSGRPSVAGPLDEVAVAAVGPRRDRTHLTSRADVAAWLARRDGSAPSV